MFSRLLFLLCLAVLVPGTAATLRAQLRDTRLAPELRDYSLPQEAQVQSVASIGDRHLVAWATTAFDADSSVINVLWMRLLDGSTPLLQNRIVHSEQARPYGCVLVVASAQQFLVFFNDRRGDAPGTYLQRVDYNGFRIGDEQRIDIGAVRNDTVNKPKSEVSALTYSWLPGWTFVQIDSARPFVVRDDAVVDTRPIAIDHMQGAYYLAEDTSVVVLKGKSLYFYRNLFDAEAERVVEVPGLDSALANSEVVMRDSAGGYWMMFGVISNPKTKACSYWRLPIADTVSTMEMAFKDYVPQPDSYPEYIGPPLTYKNYGAQRIRSCENGYRVTVRYLGWYTIEIYKGYNVVARRDNFLHHKDITVDTVVARSGYNAGTFDLCNTSLLPTLRRNDDSVITRLTMVAKTDTVNFELPKAFTRPAIPRSHPNLLRGNFFPVVTWLISNDEKRPQSRIWDTKNQLQPVSLLPSIVFGKAARNPQAQVEGINEIYEQRLVNLSGLTFSYSRQFRSDTVLYGSYMRVPVGVTYFEVQVLSSYSNRWLSLENFTGYGRDGNDGGEHYSPPVWGITWFDTDHFYNCFRIRINSDTLVYGTLPPIDPDLRLISNSSLNRQRLSPDRWLRWYLADDSTRWTFDVVDTAGTVYHSRTLRFDGDPRSIFITQNYPDRSMAIIWGGLGGVRGTFLSHSLDLLEENVQISETRDSVSYPSVAYRNDTLFVAWEDYRNGGIADVYGAAFTGAPRASGVEVTREGIGSRQALQIWPNPVRGELRLSFAATWEEGNVEVYDALGRLQLMKSVAAGSIGTTLATEALSPGAYVVMLRDAGRSTAVRCIIAR